VAWLALAFGDLMIYLPFALARGLEPELGFECNSTFVAGA
jgi:hypothetical protein